MTSKKFATLLHRYTIHDSYASTDILDQVDKHRFIGVGGGGGCRRGRDCMVVDFTITYAIRAYHH